MNLPPCFHGSEFTTESLNLGVFYFRFEFCGNSGTTLSGRGRGASGGEQGELCRPEGFLSPSIFIFSAFLQNWGYRSIRFKGFISLNYIYWMRCQCRCPSPRAVRIEYRPAPEVCLTIIRHWITSLLETELCRDGSCIVSGVVVSVRSVSLSGKLPGSPFCLP